MFYPHMLNLGKLNQTMKSNIIDNIGYFPFLLNIFYDTFIVLENN